jgi:hypothetical protein
VCVGVCVCVGAWSKCESSDTHPNKETLLVVCTHFAGLSLDHAAIEPYHNILFFYAYTVLQPGVEAYMLFYLAVDSSSGQATERDLPADRAATLVLAAEQQALSSSSSASQQSPWVSFRALSGIAAVYQETPPQLIFTRYAGLHVLVPGLSDTFPYDNGDNNNNNNNNTFSFHDMVLPISTCELCPAGKSTHLLPSAYSIDDCACPPGFFFNSLEGSCVKARTSCPPNHFISRAATPYADVECWPCPICTLGYYRDPNDCLPNQLRDVARPAKCLRCSSCPQGTYIDPRKCDPASVHDINPAIDCLSCSGCTDMHTLVGNVCPGTTLYNTQGRFSLCSLLAANMNNTNNNCVTRTQS